MVISSRMAEDGESLRAGGGARRWRIECGGVVKVMMGLYHAWPPADLFLLAKYYSVMESMSLIFNLCFCYLLDVTYMSPPYLCNP